MDADLVLVHRSREEVALAERAPEVLQRGELFVVLDPLGDSAQAELVPDPHDRARQARFLGRAEQLDERAIDLEDVDWEAVEVAQRGVAGAEVVDRQRDAELAQCLQHTERLGALIDQHRLGDLEHERARFESGLAQDREDRRHQRIIELAAPTG